MLGKWSATELNPQVLVLIAAHHRGEKPWLRWSVVATLSSVPVAHCGNWMTRRILLPHSSLGLELKGGHSWNGAHCSYASGVETPGTDGLCIAQHVRPLLFFLPQLLEAGWSPLVPAQCGPCVLSVLLLFSW